MSETFSCFKIFHCIKYVSESSGMCRNKAGKSKEYSYCANNSNYDSFLYSLLRKWKLMQQFIETDMKIQ